MAKREQFSSFLPWRIESLAPGVSQIRIPYRSANDWEWWALITSDWHWDSVKCNRDLLKANLEQAKSRGAAVLCFGDMLDVMAGRNDPRATKDELRPELLVDNYIDAVVEGVSEFLQPYAQHVALLSQGNHEHTIREKAETCVIRRVVENLNSNSFCNVVAGEYAGWLRFAFVKNRADRTPPIDQSVLLHYHHGVRGGGPADMAEMNQRASECPDADILVAGHTHSIGQRWISRTRFSKHGQIFKDDQLHLRCGGYKDDHDIGIKGWSVRKGIKSKTLGNWWLRLYWCHRRYRIWFEPIPAM